MSDAERETNKFIDETAEKWTKREEQEERESFRERISKPRKKITIELDIIGACTIIKALCESAFMSASRDTNHIQRCTGLSQEIAEKLAKVALDTAVDRW